MSRATAGLVAALTAVFLALYGVILCLNYLHARWRSGGSRRAGAGAGGIDKAALAAMPVLRFEAGPRDDDSAAVECAVCLGEVRDGEAVRALPGCGHAFHAACVDAWLRARATCPVCRARPVPPPPPPHRASAAAGPGE